MSERKRRVKTGCISCRRRRVKCDEKKPFCQRCEAANISCDGYQAPRHVDPPRNMKIQSCRAKTSAVIQTSHTALSEPSTSELPLFGYPQNPAPSQRPHQRAREILGHQQYAARTASYLFRHEHLYFWRDRVLGLAWDTECVFDAVISLGLMHRAVIMLSNPGDKWRGLDNKVVAFQIYETALIKLSAACTVTDEQPFEILTTTLLLLTWFECFAGNHTAAFRHLRLAQSYLEEATATPFSNMEPISACLSEFELVVQVLLPLPFINYPTGRVIAEAPASQDASISISRSASQDLQQLLDIICAHRKITIAVWSSLCNTEDTLSKEDLARFQETLMTWKAQAISTFQQASEQVVSHQDPESVYLLPIPPIPQIYPSLHAALAAATFHCYMGRTLCMMSTTSKDRGDHEIAAAMHAYHNLGILEGLKQGTQVVEEQRRMLSYNLARIGFVPLLFLGAQFCLNTNWTRCTLENIRFIGQEGLYCGEMFASALQALEFFDTHVEGVPKVLSAGNTGLSQLSRIIPILIPGPQEKSAVAYYVRAQPHELSNRKTKNVEILGRARWQRSIDDASTSVSFEFFDPTHAINGGLQDRCLYLQIAAHEPIARDWEALLGPDALGRHGYFAQLAATGLAFKRNLAESADTVLRPSI